MGQYTLQLELLKEELELVKEQLELLTEELELKLKLKLKLVKEAVVDDKEALVGAEDCVNKLRRSSEVQCSNRIL